MDVYASYIGIRNELIKKLGKLPFDVPMYFLPRFGKPKNSFSVGGDYDVVYFEGNQYCCSYLERGYYSSTYKTTKYSEFIYYLVERIVSGINFYSGSNSHCAYNNNFNLYSVDCQRSLMLSIDYNLIKLIDEAYAVRLHEKYEGVLCRAPFKVPLEFSWKNAVMEFNYNIENIDLKSINEFDDRYEYTSEELNLLNVNLKNSN